MDDFPMLDKFSVKIDKVEIMFKCLSFGWGIFESLNLRT